MENKKYNPNTVKNLKKLNDANIPNIIEAQRIFLEEELGRPIDFDEAKEILESRLKEGEEIIDFCKTIGVYDGNDANIITETSVKDIVKPQIKIDFNAPTESVQTAKLNFGGKD